MLLPNFKNQLLLLQQGVANKQLLKNLSSEPRNQCRACLHEELKFFFC